MAVKGGSWNSDEQTAVRNTAGESRAASEGDMMMSVPCYSSAE